MLTSRRSFRFALALLPALALIGATGLHAASAQPAPAPSALPVYVSLGDSRTVGYGAEKPYPLLLANALGERMDNIAIGGAIASTAYRDQVPLIPHDCALVTIDLGFNDANGIIDHNGVTIDDFDHYMHEIVRASHEACPQAPIVVFTIINEVRGKAVIDRINEIIRNLPGTTVVDIAGDHQLRDLSLYIQDQIHPNNAGHCEIAHDVLQTVASKGLDGSLEC